ncbi:MAG: fibronectin/fibrinogen-binding protein [Firmicutes bacterium]|nr:fibronectin/fibrinogen-binding protein [Bacillota bacterium]
MPLDGLTLKTLTAELDSLLRNGRVVKIFQPQKNTITLHLRSFKKTEILLISVDPNYPRIHTVTEQPQNPLQPPSFCMLLRKHLEPSRLLSIEQKGWDRIVHLNFEVLDQRGQPSQKILILEIMGRHSNLFFVDQQKTILDALKRYPEKDILPGGKYQEPCGQGKRDPSEIREEEFINEIRLLPASAPLWKWIQNSFQGFSKTGAVEVLERANFSPRLKRGETNKEDWPRIYFAFLHLLQEISEGGTPFWHKNNGEDFTGYSLSKGKNSVLFPSVNALIARFLTARENRLRKEILANSLRRPLRRQLKKALRKEKLHKDNLKRAEQADELRLQGELLTANFHLLKKGLSSIELTDYTRECLPRIKIELDPLLSPSANVQKKFKDYHKAKNSRKFTLKELRKARRERTYLEEVLHQIEEADQDRILLEIAQEIQRQGYLPPKCKPSPKPRGSPRPDSYISSDGIPILVGRNNRQNDYLTFRLSRPNHLWLHARKIPGSHVVIAEEGAIPESTIAEAALLAAYFSQSKNSPKVSVDYTLRKHVRKPKGAKPGFVLYERFQTIVVDPANTNLPPKK